MMKLIRVPWNLNFYVDNTETQFRGTLVDGNRFFGIQILGDESAQSVSQFFCGNFSFFGRHFENTYKNVAAREKN